MPLFRRKQSDAKVTAADEPPPQISPEAAVRKTILNKVERRRSNAQHFSVACVAPQLTVVNPLGEAEAEAATRTLAMQLRTDDQFCVLDDGSYIVVLADTWEDEARVVTRRLASELTLRSGAINQRKWLAGLARYPVDARTEPALIELAHASALASDAA